MLTKNYNVIRNRQAQARWRERHIAKRRRAQRIVNILVRKKWPEGTVKELARLLGQFLTRDSARTLRRELRAYKEPTRKEHRARNARDLEQTWLRAHPGKTVKDYERVPDDEMWEWLRARGEATVAAEKAAWERDHPGQDWPEHMCGLSDREYTDYQRWERQRERKAHKRDLDDERPAR